MSAQEKNAIGAEIAIDFGLLYRPQSPSRDRVPFAGLPLIDQPPVIDQRAVRQLRRQLSQHVSVSAHKKACQ
jgi:hypothetical protein